MLIQLAGELAIDSGVLPFDKCEIKNSIDMIVEAWIGEEQNLPAHIQGVKMIQTFLLKNPSRFYDLADSNSPPHPRDLAGYRDNYVYMFTKEGLIEACNGVSHRDSLNYIKSLGFLEHETGRLDKKASITSVLRPRLFVIKKELINHDFNGADGAMVENSMS